jgi:acetyltransferase-like isoleucine patch superfamily enzyme
MDKQSVSYPRLAYNLCLYLRQYFGLLRNAFNLLAYAASGLVSHPSSRICIGKNSRIDIKGQLFLRERANLQLGEGASLICRGPFTIYPDATIVIGDNGVLELGMTGFILNSAWIEVASNGKISIGDCTTIQLRCMLHGNIEIGDNTLLAPDVYVSSGSHSFDRDNKMTIREQDKHYSDDSPVVIGDNCWLGIRAFIKSGLNLAEGTIIGANSVLTQSTDRFSVYAGAPARKLRAYRQ